MSGQEPRLPGSRAWKKGIDPEELIPAFWVRAIIPGEFGIISETE